MRSVEIAATLLVVLAFAGSCGRDQVTASPHPATPTTEAPPTIDREPVAETVVVPEPDAPEPDVPESAPAKPASSAPQHCTTDAARGEAWAALGAVLARHEVPGDFACPKDYALVQSPQPCEFDCSKIDRATNPELFTFSGRDEASGDAIFVELAHHRKRMSEEKGPCRFSAPFREILVKGADVPRGRWAEQRFSARAAATIAPLLRRLDDHGDVTARDLPTLAKAYSEKPAKRVRLVEPGVVSVGRSENVGCPIMTRHSIVEWLLVRHDGRWRAMPTIDLVVEDVVELGAWTGIVETWPAYDADGGHYDKLRLLVFAADGGFVGPLPITFGEDTDGFGGEYAWRYAVAALPPDCIDLRGGRFRGSTFREDEESKPIGGRIKAHFAKHRGPWRITDAGLVPGCSG